MKRASLLISILVMLPAALFAQTPAAATGTSSGKVAVVDFNRAVTDNSEGKKAVATFNTDMTKLQSEFQALQESVQKMEAQLRTADKALSDATKATLTKQLETANVELNRKNEDAQKTMGDRQNELFGPVAQRAKVVLDAYAKEMGYAIVFDMSNQQNNNIIYNDEVAEITTEIIRRIDADFAKTPAGK
jgi:outer membrane protein